MFQIVYAAGFNPASKKLLQLREWQNCEAIAAGIGEGFMRFIEANPLSKTETNFFESVIREPSNGG